MTSQHDELGPRVVKLDEEVAEVIRELETAHVNRPGTKRKGVCIRVYVGSGSRASWWLSYDSRVSNDTASAPSIGLRSDSTAQSRVLFSVACLVLATARARRSTLVIDKVYHAYEQMAARVYQRSFGPNAAW